MPKKKRVRGRGVLVAHHEGPFGLDAERARHEYGWTNAECWRLVDHATRVMQRAAARKKRRRHR